VDLIALPVRRNGDAMTQRDPFLRGIHAHLDEGILTITVPKAASERPGRIEIR
jgi:hypothetical protein